MMTGWLVSAGPVVLCAASNGGVDRQGRWELRSLPFETNTERAEAGGRSTVVVLVDHRGPGRGETVWFSLLWEGEDSSGEVAGETVSVVWGECRPGRSTEIRTLGPEEGDGWLVSRPDSEFCVKAAAGQGRHGRHELSVQELGPAVSEDPYLAGSELHELRMVEHRRRGDSEALWELMPTTGHSYAFTAEGEPWFVVWTTCEP